MSFRRNDDGVSTVLGAVLVFGLLVFGLTIITSQYVPVWDKERERESMSRAAAELNDLKSDLDRMATNTTSAPVSIPLTLTRAGGYAFFRSVEIPAVLKFTPAPLGAGFALNATRLTIQESEAASFLGLSESWVPIPAGSHTTSSVTHIAHLRLRIADPANATGAANATLVDASGMCAARLHVTLAPAAGGRAIETRVFGPASPRAPACATSPLTIESDFLATAPPFLYVDALDPRLPFKPAAVAAASPATLTLSRSGIGADAALVVDTIAGGVPVRRGGSGLVVENYRIFAPVGTLELGLLHQRLPQQTYSLEYGALFLNQSDGAALATPPVFTVGSAAGRATVSWTFPALGGGAAAVSGTESANVLAAPTGVRTSLLGTAPDATFNITTAYPQLWKKYWEETLALAGLSATPVASAPSCAATTSAPHFTISTNATTATLRIAGPCQAPDDATEDVQVGLHTAGVSIAPRASH